MFGTLALIPIDKIPEAWDIILDSITQIPSDSFPALIKFIEYFANTWLTGKNFYENIIIN